MTKKILIVLVMTALCIGSDATNTDINNTIYPSFQNDGVEKAANRNYSSSEVSKSINNYNNVNGKSTGSESADINALLSANQTTSGVLK